jgi:DNA polymerase-3 subunit delta'
MAQRLLCESPRNPDQPGCGECTSCRLFVTGNHPDFRHVIPEAESDDSESESVGSEKKKLSSQILIRQIRALEEFVYVGGHRGGRRVIVIEPAEAMNASAENSLLKILEEPPVLVCFILISNKFRRLLPTIRSRCRTISFQRPSGPAAKEWLIEKGGQQALDLLALTGGTPILALKELERGRQPAFNDVVAGLLDHSADFLTLAGRMESHVKTDNGLKMDELIATIQKVLYDLLSFKTCGQLRFLAGRERQVDLVARHADTASMLAYYAELIKVRALASHPLNPRLFLDDIAARYLRATAPASP